MSIERREDIEASKRHDMSYIPLTIFQNRDMNCFVLVDDCGGNCCSMLR